MTGMAKITCDNRAAGDAPRMTLECTATAASHERGHLWETSSPCVRDPGWRPRNSDLALIAVADCAAAHATWKFSQGKPIARGIRSALCSWLGPSVHPVILWLFIKHRPHSSRAKCRAAATRRFAWATLFFAGVDRSSDSRAFTRPWLSVPLLPCGRAVLLVGRATVSVVGSWGGDHLRRTILMVAD